MHDFPQGMEHFSVRPTVESPFALFEVQMEGLFRDAVELSHVPFRLAPKVLNAIDVVMF